jgi:hypothetical protein
MNDIIQSEEFHVFPPYEEYIEWLEGIRNANLTALSVKDIKKYLYNKLLFTSCLVGTHQPERFNQLYFYRIRLNISEEENMDLIRTYSYPPPNFCKENGRANLKGRPVFYCSNDPFTAIYESKPKPGDIAYLSVWKANTNRDLKIGICLPKELGPENKWRQMAYEVNEYALAFNEKIESGKIKHLQALVNFVSERYINETRPYSLTSFLSDEMLFGERSKDFLIYPSIASKGYSCNMAFHPNVADSFLRFEKVIRFEVNEVNFPKVAYSVGRVGEIKNGNITWRKQANRDEVDFSKFP